MQRCFTHRNCMLCETFEKLGRHGLNSARTGPKSGHFCTQASRFLRLPASSGRLPAVLGRLPAVLGRLPAVLGRLPAVLRLPRLPGTALPCVLPGTPCPVYTLPYLPYVHPATVPCCTRLMSRWCTWHGWSWVQFWAYTRPRAWSFWRNNIPSGQGNTGPGKPL